MRYKNGAELEMERMQRIGDRMAKARKESGYCTHGWLQGPPGPVGKPTTVATCLHCGATWPTIEDAYAANKEAMRNLPR